MNAMTFYAGAAAIFLRYFLGYLLPVYFRFHSKKTAEKITPPGPKLLVLDGTTSNKYWIDIQLR